MPQIGATSKPAPDFAAEAEAELRAQAEQVDFLRRRLAEAQANGGKLDPVLLAEFARAQHVFLKTKIEHEHRRQMRLMEEEALEAAAAEACALERLAIESSPVVNRGKARPSLSQGFWIAVLILLWCVWLSDLLFGTLK